MANSGRPDANSTSKQPEAVQSVEPYIGLGLQLKCHAVNRSDDKTEARNRIRQSISEIAATIASSKGFIGADCRLVVLPEYFLTGFPMGDSFEGWIEKACLEVNGPEYEALGKIAQDNAIFLSGNVYETDQHFPGFYFQASFVIDPSGEVILRYRRLNSMFAATPHDVWEDYLDKYGLEGVFPVARTSIGNLAAIASEEILYPEVARCLMMRGAEVFLHSTSQTNELVRAPKEAATVCRAVENMAYVVSANSGGISGTPLPVSSADGGSKVVDFKGLVLAKSGSGETMTGYSEIDIQALRRYRRRPGMENIISRQRLELYADSYRDLNFYPANTLSKAKPDKKQFIRNQLDTIERLSKLNII